MRLPTRKSEKERLENEVSDPYLTTRRIEQLKRELARLKNERPAAIEEVRRTAEMGDFSENAAYQDAKARLRQLNNRILRIEETLNRAIPIIVNGKREQVRLGSVVTVEHDDKLQTFEIVGADEANPANGRISHKSPLGSRLLGNKYGDEVTLDVQNQKVTYRILKIQ